MTFLYFIIELNRFKYSKKEAWHRIPLLCLRVVRKYLGLRRCKQSTLYARTITLSCITMKISHVFRHKKKHNASYFNKMSASLLRAKPMQIYTFFLNYTFFVPIILKKWRECLVKQRGFNRNRVSVPLRVFLPRSAVLTWQIGMCFAGQVILIKQRPHPNGAGVIV